MLGRDRHAALLILLGKTDPGQGVAPAVDAQAADVAQQGGLVLRVDQGGVAVAQQAQVAVEALQGPLGLLAVADILHRADEPHRLALRIEQGFAALADELHAPLGPLQAVGDFARRVADHRRLEFTVHALAVVGVDEGEDAVATGREAGGVALEDAVDLVRPVHGIGAQVKLPVAQLGQALGLDQAGFAAVQLGLGEFALGAHLLQLALAVDQARQQGAGRRIR